MTSYLICAAARTGTNLLATALRQTRVAGRPLEYFNVPSANQPFMLKELGIEADRDGKPDFAARLPAILRAGTRGGIFGATVHRPQVRELAQAIGYQGLNGQWPFLDHAALPVLRACFSGLRFIHLRRNNTVAQAISHYRAIRTKRWYEIHKDPIPNDDETALPFDFDALRKLLHAAESDAAFWADLLAEETDTTLALSYEELDADFHGVILRVLRFLDVPTDGVTLNPPGYRRQADARSRAWEAQVRGMLAEQTG
jgi:LPS sulfotransferase NodH